MLLCVCSIVSCNLFTALGGGEGLPCQNDQACPAGTSCLLGRCLSCRADGDCPAGRWCVGGACLVSDAAGLDAHAIDQLAADATRTDGEAHDVTHDAAAHDGWADGSLDAATDAATDSGVVQDHVPADAGVPFVFAPAMTKRLTGVVDGGPFHVAPLIQAVDQGTCSRGDAIVVDLGLRIGGTFFEHFDSAQGTIVFWATPEWNIDDISDAARYFLRVGEFAFGVDGVARGAFVQLGSERVSFPGAFAGWTAGTTHFVSLRWDVRTGFVDGHHLVLRVDRVGYGAIADALPAPAVNTPLIIGAFNETGQGAIGAFIEGLTIYRRPLTDPNGGVDVGRPDEINDLFNIGRGIEPTLLTGSWDVVFALATDAMETALAAPVDVSQDFGHPFHDNRLGEPGYLMTAAQLTRWSPVGTGVQIAAAIETIFGGGVQISVAEPGTGSGLDFFNPGDNGALVVRALTHSDGVSVVRLRIDSAAGEIFHVDGTRTSTRVRPDVLIGTANVITGTLLHLELINVGSDSGSFHVHQVEVLRNSLRNPSFESGANGAGGDWLPDDWYNNNPTPLRTRTETSIVHSGTRSVGLLSLGTSNYASIRTTDDVAGFDSLGDFFSVGGFFYWLSGSSPLIGPDNGCLMALSGPVVDWRNKFAAPGGQVTGTWQHVVGVGRRHAEHSSSAINCQNDVLRYGGSWAASIDVLVDDAYAVRLDRVPIASVPADLSRALTSDSLRVDGSDAVSQAISGLGAADGVVTVRLALAQPLPAENLFCPLDAPLFVIYGDANNFITVNYNGSGQVRVSAKFGGALWNGWTVTQAVVDNLALHTFVVEYSAAGMVGLRVDGFSGFWASRGSTTPFSVVPQTVFFGASPLAARRCDLRVGREGASVSGQ